MYNTNDNRNNNPDGNNDKTYSNDKIMDPFSKSMGRFLILLFSIMFVVPITFFNPMSLSHYYSSDTWLNVSCSKVVLGKTQQIRSVSLLACLSLKDAKRFLSHVYNRFSVTNAKIANYLK